MEDYKMKKIVKTALTCKICGFVTEKIGSVDVATLACTTCSTAGEFMVRNFTERESKIQEAERNIQNLNKAFHYIIRERNFWKKRLKFYRSEKYDAMLILEADGDEASDRELASFLEKIEGI
jgi:hypothetical protein